MSDIWHTTKEKPMYIPAQTVEEGYNFSNCKDDILSLESKVILLILNNPNVTKKQLSMKNLQTGKKDIDIQQN